MIRQLPSSIERQAACTMPSWPSVARMDRARHLTSQTILSKVSPDWSSTIGAGSAVEFPVGVGAKGNDGVASNVQATKNAIGYVEYAYAVQNKLVSPDLINSDGKRVAAEVLKASSLLLRMQSGWLKKLLSNLDQSAGR